MTSLNQFNVHPWPIPSAPATRQARVDSVDPQTRSRIMRAVRGKGAKSTERRLRAALMNAGLKGWRLNPGNIIGRPDFAFEKKKIAIFVDGCFWHGCPQCYRRPHSSQQYWDEKVAKNMKRDRRIRQKLKQQGWAVLRFWEHKIQKELSLCADQIKERLH